MPKRRKRAPAQPAAYQPHECAILSIDPGEVSGWALLVTGLVCASGTAAGSTERASAIARAVNKAHFWSRPLVVVAETWPRRMRGGVPTGALSAWSLWRESLAESGIPKRRVVRVHVGRWSAAILGGAALTTEQRRARSIARARHETARESIDHDEAAAICIGIYASRSPEVAKVLPKRRSA
ncbi:MAG: hypothetical protein IT374_26450 [Polyangiaceae bacterium]|nr:hypothetical protein [Polyangiaceae bacterium]